MSDGIALIVRRTIRADVRRVFEAWTRPEQLLAWWGPRPVTCAGAEVDLRVGGRYRIVNAMPDGSRITIDGEFREVDAPHKLTYTWHVDVGGEGWSIVTVRFEPRADGTEVSVIHRQIASEPTRVSHEKGWIGCLDGLERLFVAG